MTMADFDWKARFGPIIDELEKDGVEHWATQLQQQLTHRFEDRPHGDHGKQQEQAEGAGHEAFIVPRDGGEGQVRWGTGAGLRCPCAASDLRAGTTNGG